MLTLEDDAVSFPLEAPAAHGEYDEDYHDYDNGQEYVHGDGDGDHLSVTLNRGFQGTER